MTYLIARVRAAATILIVASVLGRCLAQTTDYTHRLLLSNLTDIPNGKLNNLGSYLVAGRLSNGERVFILDGTHLPPFVNGIGPLHPGGGLNDRGDWLGFGVWKDDQFCRTWRYVKNGETLDDGWSSDYCWGSGGGYLSKSGKAVWTNGEAGRQYVVVDGVNYSNQWSDGYWDYSVDVQSDGTPVWYGRERGHSQIDLWIGGDPVSRRYDLGEYDWRNAMRLVRRWVDVNDAGQVAWLAAKVPDGVQHVFKGNVDLSASVGTVYAEPAVWLNESGRVLWGGALSWDTNMRLFVDDQLHPVNSLLQPDQSAVPYGLNDRGDILWLTASRIDSKYYSYVYVNDFNLTRDAFGSTGFLSSEPLALNNAGQVLWSVNTLDGKWSIYLSTPIPEPSAVAVVFPALLLMAIRRHRRPSIRGDLAA